MKVCSDSDLKSKASLFLQEAERHRSMNEHNLAVKQYLSSIMLERDNSEAYKGISLAYKGLKKYDKAIEYLKRAKEISQFDSVVYYELGLNYLMNAQPPEATKNLRRSIKLNNKNYNAQIQLAIAHELMEEYEMALLVYNKIIHENPQFIGAYDYKATLYMSLEDYKNAYHVFKQILEINPDYYAAYLGLGISCDKLGQYTKAIKLYRKYIEMKPESDTAAHLRSRIEVLKAAPKNRNVEMRLVK